MLLAYNIFELHVRNINIMQFRYTYIPSIKHISNNDNNNIYIYDFFRCIKHEMKIFRVVVVV